MEGDGFKVSTPNILTLAVVSALLMGYLYLMDSFLRKNYWWILLVVFCVIYFVFEDMNLKRQELKETFFLKSNPTFFWRKVPLLFLFALFYLLV